MFNPLSCCNRQGLKGPSLYVSLPTGPLGVWAEYTISTWRLGCKCLLYMQRNGWHTPHALSLLVYHLPAAHMTRERVPSPPPPQGVSSCVSDASGLAAACGAHEEAVADKRLEISAPPLRVRNAFASASAANPPSGSFEDTLAGWLYVVAWALVALLAYVFYLQA